MSHLIPVKIEANQFNNQEYLVKALEALEFKVRSYKKPKLFKNYFGSYQHKAEIILEKRPASNLCSEAGFIRNPDTELFELICDSMDQRKFDFSRLNKEYLKVRIETEANAIASQLNKGEAIVEWLNDDTYAIQFTADLKLQTGVNY